MATYDNRYAIKINPATPNLRGLTSTYDNTGQNKIQGSIGLGDLYELDYDRDTIEKVFNQGTDAQYALMQKENKIAQNQYANNQFANQQSAVETLRQQRNEQIASGMARGLNAAQEQGTVLGLQQEGAAGALELANKQQLAADEIAVAYADNVVKALEEANAVKQAMAGISAQLYEADMLGYTGELSAAAQMDANASNRYGSELGYEGTIYTADRNYQAAVDAANIQAGAQRAASSIASAIRYNSGGNGSGGGTTGQDVMDIVDHYIREGSSYGKQGNELISYVRDKLNTAADNAQYYNSMDQGALWNMIDYIAVAQQFKDQTKLNWEKSQSKNTNAKSNSTGNTLQDALRLHAASNVMR